MTSSLARAPQARDEPDAELVAVRRHLHSHPELRFAEHATAAFLAEQVRPYADHLRTGVAGTGLVATIETGVPGPRVLLRADMDAYPVTEANEVPYASRTPGAAHACGHDAHMTVMVGVLRRLAQQRPAAGAVDVLFQPAEEIPFGQESGARAVLDSGALAPTYAAVLGVHCWPQLPAGVVGVEPRISMAAKDGFRIEVTGDGAHAATPASGRDALLAISSIVSTLHAVVARRRNPDEMVAFNIGTIAGGVSQSSVPQSVGVTGTLRTHDEDVRARQREAIESVCVGSGVAHDVAVVLEWADAMPAVVNDPGLVALAQGVQVDDVEVRTLPRSPMTSDDFALLAQRWPGLYLKLGVAPPGATAASLHSPHFDIDERALGVGVRTVDTLTRAVLAGRGTSRD